jgi:hypothetical protein
MTRTLTFTRGIGVYKVGETYDIENETTANYFVNNHFATEEIADDGCVGCKPTEEAPVEEVVEKKKAKK